MIITILLNHEIVILTFKINHSHCKKVHTTCLKTTLQCSYHFYQPTCNQWSSTSLKSLRVSLPMYTHPVALSTSHIFLANLWWFVQIWHISVVWDLGHIIALPSLWVVTTCRRKNYNISWVPSTWTYIKKMFSNHPKAKFSCLWNPDASKAQRWATFSIDHDEKYQDEFLHSCIIGAKHKTVYWVGWFIKFTSLNLKVHSPSQIISNTNSTTPYWPCLGLTRPSELPKPLTGSFNDI